MNEILSSYFMRGDKCRTVIESPSDRVKVLMASISSGAYQLISAEKDIWEFVHRDIGTMEEMQNLFNRLQECA